MTSIHDKTLNLLPWYVNDTLPEAERRTLETHLGECLPCRAALKEEQRLGGLVRSHDDTPLSPERGTADLHAEIDGSVRTPSPMRLRPRLTYGLGLAAAAVAIGVLSPWLLVPDEATTADDFSTLTDAAAATGERLDIVFTTDTDVGDIAEVLRSIGGRLVDGPSELGRYTVSIAARGPDELDALIESLETEPAIQFVGRSYIAVPDSPEPDR
jgi:hypothetical protein